MEITKEAERIYIYTEYKRGKNAKEIFDQLTEVWGDSVSSYRTIARWVSDFKSNTRESVEDLEKSGCPVTASGDNVVQAVKNIINNDRHVTLRALAETVAVSLGTVHSIVKELQMRNVMSAWVPHDLTEENKRQRVMCATNMLSLFGDFGDSFPVLYACEDETWIHFKPQANRRNSRVWVHKNEPLPQVTRNKLTNQKCLLLIAFTHAGHYSVKALPYGETVDGDVYINFIRQTATKWRNQKNRVMLTKMFLQHDNARPHVSKKVTNFLSTFGTQILKQSPYSPDLNLLDRWVNDYIKQKLEKEVFSSHAEVEQAVMQVLKNISKEKLFSEFQNLKKHCLKVIDKGGCYITK